MAFISGKDQTNINQTFYYPTVIMNSSIPESLVSYEYVNQQVANLPNLDIYVEEINTLASQFQTLSNQLSILQAKNTRNIGEIIGLPQATPPDHYLPCDGQSYAITSYASLYAVIGDAYGPSTGVLFFVPDIKSKFLLGGSIDINGISYSNLQSGNGELGSISNNVSQYQVTDMIYDVVPPHLHDINDPGHAHGVGEEKGAGFAPGNNVLKVSTSGTANFPTFTKKVGIIVNTNGPAIQQTDTISNLRGVNYTPNYTCLNFFICYD